MPTPSSSSDPPSSSYPVAGRWALTLLTAAIAVALRAVLQPLLGDTMPFLVAYPAVVLAASLWGIASGLVVALACAIVAAVPWIPPTLPASERPGHIGAYFLSAIFICLVSNLRARRPGEHPSEDDTGFDTPLATWLRAVLWGAMLAPVTAGLTYVSLVALRKTRREQAITAELSDAVRRRATAEKGMLERQKLETLAQLTGGVAHDFNNLLAIVSSSLHVQRHLHPESADERHVQAMSRAVQSGTRLTRQLLSFSRRQALRPELIVLQAWLPAAEGLLRSTLGSRITMTVEVAADVCPVSVDAAELELALINLSLNARHAMPGGGALRISARNEGASEDGTTMVVIAVADTGVGIAPDVLPRVFEPFFTTRMNEAGSGLGLSQVHGFCAQAGGRARIASQPEQGTTVEMVLPAEALQARPPAVPASEDAGPLAGRVMLVEDNEDVAQSTAAILQAAGLEVTHHWSADAALAALRASEAPPDLVLSDIEMPGKLSGMDLAFRLRELWPQLPVVLVTGYAKQLEDAVSGGLRVLPKPTPPHELLRELRRAMGEAQPPR